MIVYDITSIIRICCMKPNKFIQMPIPMIRVDIRGLAQWHIAPTLLPLSRILTNCKTDLLLN